MKINVNIIIVFVLLFFGCKENKKPKINDSKQQSELIQNAEPSTYIDLEGNPIQLSDYKGKRILLNFWATWCRPCIEEMPYLKRAEEQLSDDNYVFLLATDQSLKTINSFKKRKGYDFKYLKYNGSFADLGIKALPKTFIYNEKGDKVKEISGAMEWDSIEIIELLKLVK